MTILALKVKENFYLLFSFVLKQKETKSSRKHNHLHTGNTASYAFRPYARLPNYHSEKNEDSMSAILVLIVDPSVIRIRD
jgi:hypothetical protein